MHYNHIKNFNNKSENSKKVYKVYDYLCLITDTCINI